MQDTVMNAVPDYSYWLGGRSFEDAKADFDENGFVIFENVLSKTELENITQGLAPHLDADLKGRNDFEGLKSNRVYALAAKSPAFVDLMMHPLALAFAEAELGDSCLLSAIPVRRFSLGTLMTVAELRAHVIRPGLAHFGRLTI